MFHLFHKWSEWKYSKVTGRSCPGFDFFVQHEMRRDCLKCDRIQVIVVEES